jgi:hypothetical protein
VLVAGGVVAAGEVEGVVEGLVAGGVAGVVVVLSPPPPVVDVVSGGVIVCVVSVTVEVDGGVVAVVVGVDGVVSVWVWVGLVRAGLGGAGGLQSCAVSCAIVLAP